MTEAETANGETAGTERRGFEAEVSRLLHLMVHSVYSDRDIFLRELVSNSSDACDKLRYEALTNPDLTKDDPVLSIRVIADAKAGTLTVSDNGIGMSKAEMIENLGTIARSGTAAFLEKIKADGKADSSLIGQFGVGFYASFMVADRVRVISRRADETVAHEWDSTGEGEYVIRPAERSGRGTDIILYMKKDASDFLEESRLKHILNTYSDHIAVPIFLSGQSGGAKKEGAGESDGPQQVNSAAALWTRAKSDITDTQYTEFYRHIAHAGDEPAHIIHTKAEGMLSYASLLFVPSERPVDLFDPARKPRVKLYVKRVFITDDTEDLLPGYLRFLRGVVDSEDISLNISREMLQSDPMMRRLRTAITKKVLSDFENLADKNKETFTAIWENFGAVLKEGIYEDGDRREQLLKLARFRTTGQDGWVSLADYVSRMKDKQTAIYYATGTDPDAVRRCPQLEGFRARDVDVLLLSDPVDDFWLSMAPDFDGKPLKSVTRGGADLKDMAGDDKLSDKADKAKEADPDMDILAGALKVALGDAVADVRISDRLTESAACLVADVHGLDIHLERILRQHKQLDTATPKILEINPDHSLIKALSARVKTDNTPDLIREPALLLLDQARLLEGEALTDPTAFAQRLSRVLEASLSAA